jgi:hypothetical protein
MSLAPVHVPTAVLCTQSPIFLHARKYFSRNNNIIFTTTQKGFFLTQNLESTNRRLFIQNLGDGNSSNIHTKTSFEIVGFMGYAHPIQIENTTFRKPVSVST